MQKTYKSGMFFEGADFQSFDYFVGSHDKSSFSMNIGSMKRMKNGKWQIGIVAVASEVWIATRFKTKVIPWYEYDQHCSDPSGNCEVYVGDVRTVPKKDGVKKLSSQDIKTIVNAMQHVAFKSVQNEIKKRTSK